MIDRVHKIISPLAFSIYGIAVMLFLAFLTPAFPGLPFLGALTQTQIIAETNPHRESQGLLPLNVNPKLQHAAQMKAEDMLARDYFAHTGPDGERPWVWLDRAGYSYALAGENLAMDFFDPKLLVNAWLNSPSHAKNILNGYYTDIGIGVAEGDMNGKKTVVAVMFVGKELTPALADLAAEPALSSESEPAPQVAGMSQEPISDTSGEAPAEEMAVVQYVDEELLNTEVEIVLASGEPLDFRQATAGTTALAVGNAAATIRLILSIFFAALVALTVYAASMHKKNHLSFSIPRVLALVLMTTILWI